MSSSPTPAERAAHARWARRRRRLIGYGQWRPFTDADPVRDHVRALMATGLPLSTIAAKTGIDAKTFSRLLYTQGDRPPVKQVRTENAEKILNYRPAPEDYPRLATVPGAGSRRRLRALATLGWPASVVAKHVGINRKRMQRALNADTVGAETARLIRQAYDDLWRSGPTPEQVRPRVAQTIRNQAARGGWHGPLAWNDDTIDDPAARPVRGSSERIGVDMAAVIRATEGHRTDLTPAERTAAVEHAIRRRGMSYDDTTEALGIPRDTVKRTWERIKARARARGETWPDAPYWTSDRFCSGAKDEAA